MPQVNLHGMDEGLTLKMIASILSATIKEATDLHQMTTTSVSATNSIRCVCRCSYRHIFWCMLQSICWCMLQNICGCMVQSIFWCMLQSIFWCMFQSIFWCMFQSIFWCMIQSIFYWFSVYFCSIIRTNRKMFVQITLVVTCTTALDCFE